MMLSGGMGCHPELSEGSKDSSGYALRMTSEGSYQCKERI